MVERKESQGGLNEFQGEVLSVEKEQGMQEGSEQYHVKIKPIDVEVGGKTGQLHEWIPLSKTSSEDAVAKGSVLDGYLRQVEICMPEAKKAATVSEALGLMVGKKFKFQKIELGRAFDGNPARQYAVPVQAL
jgi:hypothetical protein